jgi:IS5 family transposase
MRRCTTARRSTRLTKGNTSPDVFADSAYRSAETEATLKARGFRSRIHRRGRRNHPLSDAQTRANRAKSRIRARMSENNRRVYGGLVP